MKYVLSLALEEYKTKYLLMVVEIGNLNMLTSYVRLQKVSLSSDILRIFFHCIQNTCPEIFDFEKIEYKYLDTILAALFSNIAL